MADQRNNRFVKSFLVTSNEPSPQRYRVRKNSNIAKLRLVKTPHCQGLDVETIATARAVVGDGIAFLLFSNERVSAGLCSS